MWRLVPAERLARPPIGGQRIEEGLRNRLPLLDSRLRGNDADMGRGEGRSPSPFSSCPQEWGAQGVDSQSDRRDATDGNGVMQVLEGK